MGFETSPRMPCKPLATATKCKFLFGNIYIFYPQQSFFKKKKNFTKLVTERLTFVEKNSALWHIIYVVLFSKYKQWTILQAAVDPAS